MSPKGYRNDGQPQERHAASRTRILGALVRVTQDGWPASVTEVQAAAGNASRGGTYDALEQLRRAGLVLRHPRNSKGGYLPIVPS